MLLHTTLFRSSSVAASVDCGTTTVDLTTVKILLNIIVSTLNAKLMTIGIQDFYLHTPMAQSEYMRLKLSNLPEILLQHYNPAEKAARDSCVCLYIKRGMYRLPQAGLIAQQLLEKRQKKTITKVRVFWGFGNTTGARSASQPALMILV